jgi:hypothetical protein
LLESDRTDAVRKAVSDGVQPMLYQREKVLLPGVLTAKVLL